MEVVKEVKGGPLAKSKMNCLNKLDNEEIRKIIYGLFVSGISSKKDYTLLSIIKNDGKI